MGGPRKTFNSALFHYRILNPRIGWHETLLVHFMKHLNGDFLYWTSMQILKFDSDLFYSFEWLGLEATRRRRLVLDGIGKSAVIKEGLGNSSAGFITTKLIHLIGILSRSRETKRPRRGADSNIWKYRGNFSNIFQLFSVRRFLLRRQLIDKSMKLYFIGKGWGRCLASADRE